MATLWPVDCDLLYPSSAGKPTAVKYGLVGVDGPD